MPVDPPPVVVRSFDMDECIFNDAYKQDIQRDPVAANLTFLNSLRVEPGVTHIAMIGSNRQDYHMDSENGGNKDGKSGVAIGSGCAALSPIAEAIGATADPFLLADAYGALEDGTSFERIMQMPLASAHKQAIDSEGAEVFQEKYVALQKEDMRNPAGLEHAGWHWDSYKVTILYAQMQRIAEQYPNRPIDYHFYDDDTKDEIIPALIKFFQQPGYDALIPKNVTLHIHQYAGAAVTDQFTMRGTGEVDSDYKQTIQNMANTQSCFLGYPNERNRARKKVNTATINTEDMAAALGELLGSAFKASVYRAERLIARVQNNIKTELVDTKAKISGMSVKSNNKALIKLWRMTSGSDTETDEMIDQFANAINSICETKDCKGSKPKFSDTLIALLECLPKQDNNQINESHPLTQAIMAKVDEPYRAHVSSYNPAQHKVATGLRAKIKAAKKSDYSAAADYQSEPPNPGGGK